MSNDDLRGRDNWQKDGLEKATEAENNFFDVFEKYFEGTEYRIRSRPKELQHIYEDIELPDEILSEIYVPEKKPKRHGMVPDFAIDNTNTKKTIYVESKRQDGYVEGGVPEDGRGNAHERLSKYFLPGLQKILREMGNISEDVLPFWAVIQGNITRDLKRVNEMTVWFDGCEGHIFLWRDLTTTDLIINHFNEHIKPILE